MAARQVHEVHPGVRAERQISSFRGRALRRGIWIQLRKCGKGSDLKLALIAWALMTKGSHYKQPAALRV
jgi:hypothetical protein